MTIAFVIAAALTVTAAVLAIRTDRLEVSLGLLILAMVAFIIGVSMAVNACAALGGEMVKDGGAVVIMPPSKYGGVGQVVPTTSCSVEGPQ